MTYVQPNVGILEPYDAKFIVRGGATELLRGEVVDAKLPDRIVFVQFPSLGVLSLSSLDE
jgi:uncharacterized protein (DUF1330 family)